MIKKILRSAMLRILLASTMMALLFVGYIQGAGLIIGKDAAYRSHVYYASSQQHTDCLGAAAQINSAKYDSAAQRLEVSISNTGSRTISFYCFLTYKNGTVVRYPSIVRNMAPGTTTFEISGVDASLDQVTIQSMECMYVQDLIYIK